MRSRTILATVISLAASAAPAFAIGLPTPTGLPTQQPTPVTRPYDTAADAHAEVAAAFERARKSGRNVLIDCGANWCPDCRMLSGVLQMPEVQPWLNSHFEVVMVNVDHDNVNMDIPAKYGVTVKPIPAVLVLTPQGKLLDPDGVVELGNARSMSPQAAIDLLAKWDARGR